MEARLKKIVKFSAYVLVFITGSTLVMFGLQNKHSLKKGELGSSFVQKAFADAPGDSGDTGDGVLGGGDDDSGDDGGGDSGDNDGGDDGDGDGS